MPMTSISPRTKQTSIHMLLSLTSFATGKTVRSTRRAYKPYPCPHRLPFWLKIARPNTPFYPPHSALEQPVRTSDKALRPSEAPPPPFDSLQAGGEAPIGATDCFRRNPSQSLTFRGTGQVAALRTQLARPRCAPATSGKCFVAQFRHLGRRPGVVSSRGYRTGSQVALRVQCINVRPNCSHEGASDCATDKYKY
jgi:hypothetical protein